MAIRYLKKLANPQEDCYLPLFPLPGSQGEPEPFKLRPILGAVAVKETPN